MAFCLDHQAEAFDALPLPLPRIGPDFRINPAELMGEGRVFGPGPCRSDYRSRRPVVEGSLIALNAVPVLVGRTTPLVAWEEGEGISSVTLCHTGRPLYREESTTLPVLPGGILLHPRDGGCISTGLLASINFPLEHRRLARVLQAMGAADLRLSLDRPIVLAAGHDGQGRGGPAGLFAFFRFLEELLLESRYLGSALGLDEQLYRLMALALLQSQGSIERLERRWGAEAPGWSSRLDELVDYIRTHANCALTLTDLEEQSRYSARHLQNLFRQKFDCTPMQFVRRQKLELAMEKLQNAPGDATVSRIARDCGYRHLASFSSDFRRAFGVAPSVVLRRSRQSDRGPARRERSSPA